MFSLPAVRYLPETADHAAAIEAIAAEAFGPGRFARAAERVREMSPHDENLSFVAIFDGVVVGSVRQTPIAIGSRACVMLGPLAVRPVYKGQGVGRRLMALAEAAARDRGETAIMLVGDRAYYMPLGYRPLPAGSVTMPGPVDPARILGLPLVDGGLEGLAGRVRSRG
ncbi:N-acetyltransferase GCN5 [Aureimonas sp. SA4125]|uniref:GNAT family N-acetyltransferase n=1 Tax=Aureimonas sp. SA4125 TaxID=2826993 RepID=UPI001CC80563|nr:N-acetyltransferase [Aureimonas sp. SA4125]BDA85846.1 N-acetyltransferase GCN5 [Aureimonas sp. SA4125]